MAEAFPRLLGVRRGDTPGPTLLIVGGQHGNEPAGARAARRVLELLEGVSLTGDLVAFAGNVRALARGRRFVDRDLNRQWSAPVLARAAGDDDSEAAELRELGAALGEAVAAARGPVHFLDLHTTSAAGVPFGLIGNDARQRRFGGALSIPMLVGLEDRLQGVLSHHLAGLGAVPIAVEGGQHDSPEAQANLEAVILLAAHAAGLVATRAMPELAQAQACLAAVAGGLPRAIEVVARHAVRPGDGFVMEPGFANVAAVAAGELLARDRTGELRAPSDGFVLLPLYQPEGEDGYFFGRARDAAGQD
jgi:succinylglutamate desuccinylase